MSAAVKKQTVFRALTGATRRAWRALRAHEAECQLCVDDGYFGEGTRRYERCEVGRLLVKAWIALKDLEEEPSRWCVVEVIERADVASVRT